MEVNSEPAQPFLSPKQRKISTAGDKSSVASGEDPHDVDSDEEKEKLI